MQSVEVDKDTWSIGAMVLELNLVVLKGSYWSALEILKLPRSSRGAAPAICCVPHTG